MPENRSKLDEMQQNYIESLEDFLGLPRGSCVRCREMAKTWREQLERFLGLRKDVEERV
jgi:predicted deacetylase